MRLPEKFPEGTEFADVEGVPVSKTSGWVVIAWDVPGGRLFLIDSFLRNGRLISEATFRRQVALLVPSIGTSQLGIDASRQDEAKRSAAKNAQWLLAFVLSCAGAGVLWWLHDQPTAVRHTPSAEAYEAYLQGNYFRDRQNLDKAIPYYEQALRLDEHYAAAMVGLARARFGFSFGVRPDTEVVKARQLIDRAIALDPQLAEAYLARAHIALVYDFNWAAAEVSLKRARELEPSNVGVLRVTGRLARILGRFDESAELFRQALALDPLNTDTHQSLGRVLLKAGNLTAAEASFRKALELNSQYPGMHYGIALTHLIRKEPEKALEEAQLELDPAFRLSALTVVYHALRRKSESDAALRELTEKHANEAFRIAECHAYRGEVDQAMRWLEQAHRNHDAGVAFQLGSQLLSSTLARDRRYQAFLRKLNLPTEVG